MPVRCNATSSEQVADTLGGGTVVLEDDAGEFMVLVSAVAEPIRPGLYGATIRPVERALPSQVQPCRVLVCLIVSYHKC